MFKIGKYFFILKLKNKYIRMSLCNLSLFIYKTLTTYLHFFNYIQKNCVFFIKLLIIIIFNKALLFVTVLLT